jgi:hypothetical protein
MINLDYSKVMPCLIKADRDFTEEFGCGAPYQDWDKALELAVQEYNKLNGTDFDPVEARHQYLDQQQAKYKM